MKKKLIAMLCLLLAGPAAFAAVPKQPVEAPQAETLLRSTHGELVLTNLGKKLMQKAHGFSWGSPQAPAKAIVFFDPNCLWCHRFYLQVAKGVAQGKARYWMVPVAILKKSSLPKAERIIVAKDPQTAFLQNEKGFDESSEEGGLPNTLPKSKKHVVAGEIVAVNTAILADLENDKPATPTFVVASPFGTALHAGFKEG